MRFWLEQNGFEVRTSETADFPHPLDREAEAASLVGIDDADVYLLIVGFRAGTVTRDGISVTRAELRHARELLRASGSRPRMLTLVRSEVLTLHRNPPAEAPADSQDWQAVRELIDEAATADNSGDANWIQGFGSFREITEALGATLGLRGPIPRMVAATNLEAELLWNVRLLLRAIPSGMPKPITYLEPGHLPEIPDDLTSSVTIPYRAAQVVVFLAMALPPAGAMRDAALREAVVSGHFLNFDPATSRLVAGPVAQLLLAIQEAMQRFDGTAEVFRTDKTIAGDRARILAAAQMQNRSSARIAGYTARWIWALHSDIENLLKLWRDLYRYLVGATETVVRTPETARVIDAEVQRDIKAEQITDELADWWFRTSKWPDPELDQTAALGVE